MNAKVPLAKMELHAKTMLTLIHVPVDLASLASTVKITSLTALKARALMEEHVQTKSTATPVLAGQASQAPTASMK